MNAPYAWFTDDELRAMGFAAIGREVRISRRASIHQAPAISLGDHVRIDDFCVLTGGEGIELGRNVHLGCFCALFGGAGIALGDFAGLSARVSVYSESDDYSGATMTNPTVPARYRSPDRGRVVIGRHVIVGAGSTVLPGVQLGEGAAVGAHSLVTRDCQPWTMYFGTPAKKLRARSRDLLALERHLLDGE